MANKIFREMLKPQAKLPSNGFDNSFLYNFTAKIGELLPVMCLETVPRGHYEIKVSDLMRTIPMNNPAFIRASQHFEFYFVPYKQLWHRWDDFYTARCVPNSASVSPEASIQAPQYAPNIDLEKAMKAFADLRFTYSNYDPYGDLGEYIGYGCSKIANLLGYGGLSAIGMDTATGGSTDYYDRVKNLHPNAFRAAAYQKICFDYYRQPFYDLPTPWSSRTFNFDDVSDVYSGEVSESIAGQFSQQSRYGRLFQLHYRQWKKDLCTGVLPSTQFGAVSVIDVGSSASSSIQIAAQTVAANLTSVVDGPSKVYPTERTDDGADVSSTPIRIDSSLLDYSDGSFLSIETTDGGVVVDTPVQLGSNFGRSLTGTAFGSIDIPAHTAQMPSAAYSFDVLSLVRSQAIQRWRETTLRSGFRNVDQYEGHFGVRPVFTEKDRCVFIDSVSSPLQVNTVTNTNAGAYVQDGQSSTHVPLGDLGANGISTVGSDKTIKFDAKDFGVIMCIYSVLPECTYDDLGLSMMNQKVLRDDFFTPEYENIGMQPLTTLPFEFISGNGAAYQFRLGYVPRYTEYKIGVDRQSAEFFEGMGSFDEWSPSRPLPVDPTNYSISDFYVSPMYFRNIFVNAPWLAIDDRFGGGNDSNARYIGSSKTDTFIHQCYFDIKSVLPMSVLGLPSY